MSLRIGFLGDEEIVDEVHLFAKGLYASLVFVTDEGTQIISMEMDSLYKEVLSTSRGFL